MGPTAGLEVSEKRKKSLSANNIRTKAFQPVGSLHKEQLYDLYCSQNSVRMFLSKRWSVHVACVWERRGAYSLVGKPEGKRPLGRPRCRWKDNIKIHIY